MKEGNNGRKETNKQIKQRDKATKEKGTREQWNKGKTKQKKKGSNTKKKKLKTNKQKNKKRTIRFLLFLE
jgi:hypothetical protein